MGDESKTREFILHHTLLKDRKDCKEKSKVYGDDAVRIGKYHNKN